MGKEHDVAMASTTWSVLSSHAVGPLEARIDDAVYVSCAWVQTIEVFVSLPLLDAALCVIGPWYP